MSEAWYMDDSSEDQRQPHQLSPSQPVSHDQLKKIGVLYFKVFTFSLLFAMFFWDWLLILNRPLAKVDRFEAPGKK
jgi:hypothetical protein